MSAIFRDVDTFVKQTLPTMLQGHKRLKARFVTYNTVQDIPNGPFETGTPTLSMLVASGGREITMDDIESGLDAATAANPELCRAYVDTQRRKSAEALKKTGNPEIAQNAEGVHDLFVIYLGLSGFEPSVQQAAQWRMHFPSATILGVSCDCIHDRDLLPALEHGGLTAAIITPFCGGRNAMRTIFNGVLAHTRAHA